MAILWCGAEDLDFRLNISGVTTAAADSYRRVHLGAGAGVTTVPLIGSPFPGGAITSCWLHSKTGAAFDNGNAEQMLIGLTRSTKTAGEGLWLKVDTPKTRIALGTWDGSSFVELAVDTGFHVAQASVPYFFDMQVTSYGASATVNVYVNGNLACTFTGDTRISSLTDLDQVAIVGDTTNQRTMSSEVVVADEDTRAMRLVTLAPNATDGGSTFTGNATTIDETSLDQADSSYSNTNDNIGLFGLTDTAGTYAVKAVMLSVRATKSSDSTPTKIALGVKSGASTDAGSDQALTTDWAHYMRLMTTNPITTNPWTTAELDALLLQVKARA